MRYVRTPPAFRRETDRVTDSEPDAITLRNGRSTLTVHPNVAMIATSLMLDNTEFLTMPRTLAQYRDGSCTGMPLLHPWANRLEHCRYPQPVNERPTDNESFVEFDPNSVHLDANGLAIHGTIRTQPFVVQARTANAITANFDFACHPELLASFPFPHEIAISYELVASGVEHRCEITTAVRNTGATPMPISFGWHPFFALPSRPRSAWRLRTPACQRHELTELLLPTGITFAQPEIDDVIGERTYDDHFALTDDRIFVISDDQHSIIVEFDDGYQHLQIYLPGADGLLPGDFVCIEPMTAPTNALVAQTAPLLSPAATYTAAFSITLT